MTITDFTILPLTEQLELLYIDGTYIGKRTAGSYSVLLYQYGKWYVEINYRKYRRAVAFTRCTDSPAIIDPYLDQIPLHGIIDSTGNIS